MNTDIQNANPLSANEANAIASAFTAYSPKSYEGHLTSILETILKAARRGFFELSLNSLTHHKMRDCWVLVRAKLIELGYTVENPCPDIVRDEIISWLLPAYSGQNEERHAQAQRIYNAGIERVKTTPPPQGQKYPPGTRVRIADDLGPTMSHFPSGKNATVRYTYAHAFGNDDVDCYCLDIDGHGEVAWYDESQLTPKKAGDLHGETPLAGQEDRTMKPVFIKVNPTTKLLNKFLERTADLREFGWKQDDPFVVAPHDGTQIAFWVNRCGRVSHPYPKAETSQRLELLRITFASNLLNDILWSKPILNQTIQDAHLLEGRSNVIGVREQAKSVGKVVELGKDLHAAKARVSDFLKEHKAASVIGSRQIVGANIGSAYFDAQFQIGVEIGLKFMVAICLNWEHITIAFDGKYDPDNAYQSYAVIMPDVSDLLVVNAIVV